MAHTAACVRRNHYVAGREHRTRLGKYYDTTPILQKLPKVGSVIKATKKTYAPSYTKDARNREYTSEPLAFGKKLEVRYYTQGIEFPLKPNNFCICSYLIGDSCMQTLCISAVDLSLGLVEVEFIDDADEVKN